MPYHETIARRFGSTGRHVGLWALLAAIALSSQAVGSEVKAPPKTATTAHLPAVANAPVETAPALPAALPSAPEPRHSLPSRTISPAETLSPASAVSQAPVEAPPVRPLRAPPIGPDLSAEANRYKLSSMDELRIRAVEWRRGKGEYNDWTVLGGDYVIDASGMLSLPLLGTVKAKGKSPIEVSQLIAKRLAEQAGLVVAPTVSVEIIKYRPVYVVGDVQTAGEYAFRPGLTIMKAIAIAGGFARSADEAQNGPRTRTITAGTAEKSRLEYRRLVVRRERLQAEMKLVEAPGNKLGEPVFTPKLTGAGVAALIAKERKLMVARMAALQSIITGKLELKDLMEREISALNKKIVNQREQVELAQTDVRNSLQLWKQKLTIATRNSALLRAAAETEARLLDLETAVLKASQTVVETDRSIADVRAEWRAKIVTELQDTEAQIELKVAELRTTRSLLTTGGLQANLALGGEGDAAAETVSHRFMITRVNEAGAALKIEATADTELFPDDVLLVIPQPMSDDPQMIVQDGSDTTKTGRELEVHSEARQGARRTKRW